MLNIYSVWQHNIGLSTQSSHYQPEIIKEIITVTQRTTKFQTETKKINGMCAIDPPFFFPRAWGELEPAWCTRQPLFVSFLQWHLLHETWLVGHLETQSSNYHKCWFNVGINTQRYVIDIEKLFNSMYSCQKTQIYYGMNSPENN